MAGIFFAYFQAFFFALSVSMPMIRFRVLERMIMPVFLSVQSVPKIAIAPLILLWVAPGAASGATGARGLVGPIFKAGGFTGDGVESSMSAAGPNSSP